MRSQLRVLAIALVAILQLTGNSQAASENDANTGSDASDSANAPTLVLAGSAYNGLLHLGDTDWYASPAPQGDIACTTLTATTDRVVPMTLSLGERTIRGFTDGSLPTTMALAGRTSTPPKASLVDAGSLPGTPYSFSLASLTPGSFLPGDAASGTDAGATFATGLPLTGSCIAGTLDPGHGDLSDLYIFDAQAGGHLVLSAVAATGATLRIRVTGEDGSIFTTIGTDEVVNFSPLVDGTYGVGIESTQELPVSYIIGVTGTHSESGPGSPCRPMCAASSGG
jgi:hypothetical protein